MPYFSRKTKEYIDKLQELFPIAFPKKPLPKVPLAIGSVKVVQKVLNVNHAVASNVLYWWCRGERYDKAMVAGAPRYRLDGKIKGFVLEQHAKGEKVSEN